MYEIGQQVVVGGKTGEVIGYEFLDGEMYVGIMYGLSLISGRVVNHIAWYTEDELKEYRTVPERGESA